MNKTIVKVFVILGILVLALLIWAFVFGNGIASIVDAVGTPINNIYKAISGNTQPLIPKWNVSNKATIGGASSVAFK